MQSGRPGAVATNHGLKKVTQVPIIRSDTADADAMISIRDRCLGASLLYPFAEDMARRLARINMGPVLEVAAGTGVLTLATALVMSADITIIATDPDPATLEYASAKPGMARVVWQQADPRSLPFKDAIFGIITCLFRPAVLPDRLQAFAEVRRVMKPGGRFLFTVPSHIRHNPVAEAVQQALTAMFPNDAPTYLERDLYGYADSEMIDDDLTAAGFTDAIYTTVELPFVAASAREVAVGFCQGTSVRREIEAREAGETERVTDRVTHALEQRFGHGQIVTTMRSQVVLASG